MRFFDLVGFVLGADGRHDGVAGWVEVSAVGGVSWWIGGDSPMLEKQVKNVCSNEAASTCDNVSLGPAFIVSIGPCSITYR